MKNLNFLSFPAAKKHFNKASKRRHDCDIYLIEDHETNTFSVISGATLNYLKGEYNLHMTIKDKTTGQNHIKKRRTKKKKRTKKNPRITWNVGLEAHDEDQYKDFERKEPTPHDPYARRR